jgi:D-alanyl-D-alanine carboxypeptidase
MDRRRRGCRRRRYRHHRYRRDRGHDARPACLLAATPAARPRRDHRNRSTGCAGRGAHRRPAAARHQRRRQPGQPEAGQRRRFFRIGSNTKTFLSVVVLQLVAEHRLSLDDTVGHWLPGVVHGNGNDGGKITVRELLQHTSGLHDDTDDLQAQITSPEAYRKLEFHQFSRQDLLDIALAHRPDNTPGAAWNYSNTNYILLGMVIEKVAHDSWENQVTRRIIIPLGFHHTYAPGTSTRLPAPHATGYLIFDKDTRIDTTAENMSWADSAGALISTAADLTRFWSAIGRGALLGPAQTREMRQTVPATGGDSASVPGSRYGLGIFFIPLSCGGGYWSHEGDVPGYNTIGVVSSDGHTTVALSVNSNVDDPVLAAEYELVDHVMCHR